jgi:hypothetical protein
MSIKNKNNLNIKLVVVGLGVLLLIVASGFKLKDEFFSNSQPVKTPVAEPVIREETINYAPATDEEKSEAESHKEELISRLNQESSANTNKKQVSPVISRAQQNGFQIEINSYVTGVVEDGGTCTLSLRKGDLTITKTGTAFKDATTTICAPFLVPSNELEPGKWTALVAYTSNSASGISEEINFSVE